jgi:SAM-dependent methyltransferase
MTPPSPDRPRIKIAPRDRAGERIPDGGGVECFDTPEAQTINRARIEHALSLGILRPGQRVLDAGCGVGHLANTLGRHGCRVRCIDGREGNIASLRQRYPDLEATVEDTEGDLDHLGRFDVVFCYGLLYHLENPMRALRSFARLCTGQLLLETMVCDHEAPLMLLADETGTVSQALHGLGARPTPSFLTLALNRAGFRFVYRTARVPAHDDFRFDWRNDLAWTRDGHPLRIVLVASHGELELPTLERVL